MATSLAQYKTALTAAQTAYLSALETLYGTLIDLESIAATIEAIGGGPQIKFGAAARDQWQNLQTHLEHAVAAPRANLAAALRTSAATLTSSPTLTFAAVPAWVAPGMVVTDLTTGTAIGTVLSATPQGTTVTLAANAANAVGLGDLLSFSMTGRIKNKIDDAIAAYIANWSGS